MQMRKGIGVAAKEKPKYVFRRLQASVSPSKTYLPRATAIDVSPHLPSEFLPLRQGKRAQNYRFPSEIIATTAMYTLPQNCSLFCITQ